MVDAQIVREALRKNKVKTENFKGIEYLRFTDDFKDIPRGTVLFKDFVVWGYPHIGRIFQLSVGLPEQFNAPVWVEEKVDGYNTRIFLYKDEIYALTRGGYICAFTTDRVREFIKEDVFEENPDLVLCAEVAGPENPYVEESPPYVKEDIAFFVFDIMKKGEQGFLTYREKLKILEKYGLPHVEIFGRFELTQISDIKRILKMLNEEKREGVVFKEDSERDKRVKYITSFANINDIRVTSLNILGLPADYYTNRLLRLALFIEEEQITKDESLYTEIGKAFLEGIFRACEMVRSEDKVYRTFRCRFNKKENALFFLEQIKHASAHIQIIERRLEKEGKYYLLEFDKVYLNMTGLLGHLLKGGSVID